MLPLRFEPYHRLDETPNVVVDGSAGPATRLVLSHWPGSPTPPEVADDLSAQIAFHALDHPRWFDDLTVVTNNHFDQDGLCSAYVLTNPELALARRDQLIDLARAGDFGTFVDRDSARLSMAIAAYADPNRSPLDAQALAGCYEEKCGYLYQALLPRLGELRDNPARARELWAEEDAHLQLSLDALAAGAVTIEESPNLDLAVVTLCDPMPDRTAHRFTQDRTANIHPMAVNNATSCMRVMTIQDDRVSIEQRYETWVMYPSRRLHPRQDLQLLAAELISLEPGNAIWHGDPPSDLTPHLKLANGDSRLSHAEVRTAAEQFFATAPQAWDPFAPT